MRPPTVGIATDSTFHEGEVGSILFINNAIVCLSYWLNQLITSVDEIYKVHLLSMIILLANNMYSKKYQNKINL